MPQDQSSIRLNSAEISAPSEATVRVGTQPYERSEQLDRLRRKFHGAYLFKRRGRDNSVISVPMGRQEPIGKESAEARLTDHPPLLAALARKAILELLFSLNRRVHVPRPLIFLSDRSEDFLLRRAAEGIWSPPEWLAHRVEYQIDTRFLNPHRDAPPRILLLCKAKTGPLIEASCATLIKAGVPLKGRYVMKEVEGGDPRLRPKSNLLGQVQDVDDNHLLIRYDSGRKAEVSPDDVKLERRFSNYKDCIRSLAGDAADTVLNRLVQLQARINGGRQQYKRVKSVLRVFREKDLELAQSVPLRIGPVIGPRIENDWLPDVNTFQKPVLVFDPGGNHTDKWNERGLRTYGPYDQSYFSPQRPQIAVICEEQEQGQVETFLRSLLNGISTSGGNRSPFKEGFVRRYALDKPELSIYTTPDRRPESYRRACLKAVQDTTERRQEWSLAIVQIRDGFDSLRGDANPYLVAKSTFMKRQVPVQAVKLSTMTSPPYDLQYILNDISLASYAKMGGIPWVMEANPGITHEIVMGLGRASFQESRRGAPERHVGVSTVFSGDGRYILDSRTSAASYDKYAAVLKESLEGVIDTIRQEQNWRKGEPVRIVVHAFKKLKDVEADTLSTIIGRLEHDELEYAFVHFAERHPYTLFDLSQDAPRAGTKGKFAPSRGTGIQLAFDRYLISLVGGRDVKQEWAGMPTPALLQLHSESNFRDLKYLGRQVYRFACHSWRGFSPSPQPITLLYADRIARLLRQLKDVSGWDPEAMLGRIGRTPWYL